MVFYENFDIIKIGAYVKSVQETANAIAAL